MKNKNAIEQSIQTPQHSDDEKPEEDSDENEECADRCVNWIRSWIKKNAKRGIVDLLIICPGSPIYRCFNTFVTICRLSSCYIYGYLAAFRMSQN